MRQLRSILEEIQRQTGWKQAELATQLAVSQPTISRWLTGRQQPEIDQRDRILKLARKRGIVKGSGTQETYTVPVVGYVGAGGQVLYAEGQGPFGEAPMPRSGEVSEELVAVVVRGDSMAGQLEDGWLVYYDGRVSPPTHDLINKLCVVGLPDGRVLIKKLLQGSAPGTFHLISLNAAPITDQFVEWAARVVWIAPS